MTDLRTAAQQALEALERGAIRFEAPIFYTQAIAALKAALEQTEQEPVAWMREGWGPDCGPYVEFYRNDEMGWRDRNEWTPLYTHPPRREWRSLSKEEIHAALPHEPGDLDFVCARAIEAALRSKNHE